MILIIIIMIIIMIIVLIMAVVRDAKADIFGEAPRGFLGSGGFGVR